MLTPEDLRYLIRLIDINQYHGWGSAQDPELKAKLEAMKRTEEGRAFVNMRDENGNKLPVDGKRRSS
jgi:hypothetical protein